MIALTVLLVFAGGIYAGERGTVVFFGIALVMNAVNYWFSDKIVLRTRL